MDLSKLAIGANPPWDVNVIVEVPMGAEPIKYEMDKESGAMFVDRFLHTAMHYPCNYGFIPHTLSGDGDPADVLVVMPLPLIPGCVIRCRPVGMLQMTDEAGEDTKIIAVPINKVFPAYAGVQTIDDLPELTRDRIQHFFEHYKDLEKGKWVKVEGWAGPDAARQEILTSIARYQLEPEKPQF